MNNVIYSDTTKRFLKDLTQQSKIPHNPEDRHLRKPKELRGVRKLYEADTSKFEPTLENRNHLIKTLMPMVVQIAKQTCGSYGSKIEYDDCISAGMQGAIIATNIYIEKSKKAEQPAKLSTYAHSYILKYIREYCHENVTILSHGPTQGWNASQSYVMSGNQAYPSEGRSAEFFDIANDQNLMTHQDENNDLVEDATIMSRKLFGKLSDFQRRTVFLTFGIGCSNAKPLTPKQIAVKMKSNSNEVKLALANGIEIMKKSIENSSAENMLMVLRQADLSRIPEWNL